MRGLGAAAYEAKFRKSGRQARDAVDFCVCKTDYPFKHGFEMGKLYGLRCRERGIPWTDAGCQKFSMSEEGISAISDEDNGRMMDKALREWIAERLADGWLVYEIAEDPELSEDLYDEVREVAYAVDHEARVVSDVDEEGEGDEGAEDEEVDDDEEVDEDEEDEEEGDDE